MCDEEGKGVHEQGQQRYDSPLLSESGRTVISDTVVATIARMAAQEVEGVHMGGSASLAAGGIVGSITGSESQTSSVSVEVGAVEVAIDLTVGIEYSRNILQTVEEVRRRISERVQNLTGLRVTELNATINNILFPEGESGRRIVVRAGTSAERRPLRESPSEEETRAEGMPPEGDETAELRSEDEDETRTLSGRERRPGTVKREAEDQVPHNPRYEQSITVVTLFFAAILGFGLNHILETEHTERGSIIAHHRWGFFFVAVFIFLRFLTGSANHLWLEYVKYNGEHYPGRDLLFTVDVASLTLFGCLGVAMCYAQTEHGFFFWTAWLLITALLWSIYDGVRNALFHRFHWRSGIGAWSPTWITLNLIQLSAVIWVVWKAWGVPLFIFIQPWQLSAVIWVWKASGVQLFIQSGLLLQPWCVICCSVGEVDRALCCRLVDLTIVSALILAADFYAQLKQLARQRRV